MSFDSLMRRGELQEIEMDNIKPLSVNPFLDMGGSSAGSSGRIESRSEAIDKDQRDSSTEVPQPQEKIEQSDQPDPIKVSEYLDREVPKYKNLSSHINENGRVSPLFAQELREKTPESTFTCIGCIDEGAQVQEGAYAIAGNGVLYWMENRMVEYAQILIKNRTFTLTPHDNCGAKKAAMDLYNERTTAQNKLNGTNQPLFTDQYEFFEKIFLVEAQLALLRAGCNEKLQFEKIGREKMIRPPHHHPTALFTINGTTIDLSLGNEYPNGFVSSLKATEEIQMSIKELLFALEKIVFSDHGIGGSQDFLPTDKRFILSPEQPFLVNIMVSSEEELGEREKEISKALNASEVLKPYMGKIRVIGTIIPQKQAA